MSPRRRTAGGAGDFGGASPGRREGSPRPRAEPARPARTAFTMVELVVVAVIVTIIIGSLYQFLISGSKQVSLGSEEIEEVRRANLAMERIKGDLRAICDVVDVNGGSSEMEPDGLGMTFMRFSADSKGPTPRAFKVVYKIEKLKVKRVGRATESMKLSAYYGDSKKPVLEEDCFSEIRFKKYRLNGLPFYQIRMGVSDLTGKTGQTHYLQTSVGSRYYHAFLGDPNWLALEESAFVR